MSTLTADTRDGRERPEPSPIVPVPRELLEKVANTLLNCGSSRFAYKQHQAVYDDLCSLLLSAPQPAEPELPSLTRQAIEELLCQEVVSEWLDAPSIHRTADRAERIADNCYNSTQAFAWHALAQLIREREEEAEQRKHSPHYYNRQDEAEQGRFRAENARLAQENQAAHEACDRAVHRLHQTIALLEPYCSARVGGIRADQQEPRQ